MDSFAIFSIVLGIIGIIGGFLPVLPGPPVSWIALLCIFFSGSAHDKISVTALIIWFIAALAITVFDYILPGIMAKITGGHKAAGRGATIGLIVGLFFTPVGMVAGSFIGAFLGEFIAEDQGFMPALKAASGTFLAFILTTGAKVIFGAMAMWEIVSLLH